MAKRGRPTRYQPEFAELAYKFCLLGTNDVVLAKFFGVEESTIEEWILEIEEFKNAIIKAMEDYPEHIKYKEEKRAKRREYRKQPHVRKRSNEYLKNKVKNDHHYKIRWNISSLIRSRLKSKEKGGIFKHLGYSVQDLISHLENQFVEGMTWDNYGEVWHIDHIRPDSWFEYTSVEDEEFRKCWCLDNLQPLFVKDNLRKSNRYAG